MTDKSDWPDWLKQADTKDAQVEILPDGGVVWHAGEWHAGDWHGGRWCGGRWHGGRWNGGTWQGGEWRGGTWLDGIWHDGDWRSGVWRGGVWLGGTWRGVEWLSGTWRGGDWQSGFWVSGQWLGGTWRGGDWRGGVWHGGVWHGGEWHAGDWRGGRWMGGTWCGGTWLAAESRIHYMASLAGIAYDGTHYLGYRVTQRDGRGRYTDTFVQPEGNYYEDDIPPSGSGTCVAGIHVTSAARAWTYFGIDPNAQMWEVRFSREDLLDCDGEKARIRGGIFRKINRPF